MLKRMTWEIHCRYLGISWVWVIVGKINTGAAGAALFVNYGLMLLIFY